MGLAGEQAAVVVLGRRLRREPRHDRHRALVQGAGGAPVGVPLEAAVRRVGGLPGDPRQLERPAVDPGPVVVAVGQEHRPVRHDGVQLGGGRHPARERRHRPAAPEDPREVGVGLGIGPDGREVVRAPGVLGQVAPGALQPALHGVHVGVHEAGREQATGEIDDRPPPGHLHVADRRDPAVLHEDHGSTAVVVTVEERSVDEGGVVHGASVRQCHPTRTSALASDPCVPSPTPRTGTPES